MSSDEEPPATSDSPTTSETGDTESEPESKPSPTLPKSDVSVAFGPQKEYWVRCGHRWRFVRSQHSIWSDIGINEPFWVAFKHTTGFLIGGDDDDGKGRIIHSYNDKYMVPAGEVDAFIKSRDAYLKLHDWLGDQCGTDDDKVREVSVTIGPKGSYFARHGSIWISHALPQDLQTALEEGKKIYSHSPVTVALGIKGAWIVLWSDGKRSWNLRHSYPMIIEHGMLSGEDGSIMYAALNPYEDDSFFLAGPDGAISYKASVTPKSESAILHEVVTDYTRMRAKKVGASHSYPVTRDGITSHVSITPTSYKETGKMRSLVDSWIERRNLPVRNDVAFVWGVAGAAGLISKVTGAGTARAVGVAASTGVGAAFALWYRGDKAKL